MIGEPYAIVRPVEGVALGVHLRGVDEEDGGFAVAGADAVGGVQVGREVDVLAALGLQALGEDGIEEAGGRAVVEPGGRCERPQAQVDGDGVALAGADALAVFADLEALLVVAGGDAFDLLAREGAAVLGGAGDELVDGGPAAGVEHEADGLRLVAQDVAEEFAGGGVVVGHECSPSSAFTAKGAEDAGEEALAGPRFGRRGTWAGGRAWRWGRGGGLGLAQPFGFEFLGPEQVRQGADEAGVLVVDEDGEGGGGDAAAG